MQINPKIIPNMNNFFIIFPSQYFFKEIDSSNAPMACSLAAEIKARSRSTLGRLRLLDRRAEGFTPTTEILTLTPLSPYDALDSHLLSLKFYCQQQDCHTCAPCFHPERRDFAQPGPSGVTA